jgi:hypothetical protein
MLVDNTRRTRPNPENSRSVKIYGGTTFQDTSGVALK